MDGQYWLKKCNRAKLGTFLHERCIGCDDTSPQHLTKNKTRNKILKKSTSIRKKFGRKYEFSQNLADNSSTLSLNQYMKVTETTNDEMIQCVDLGPLRKVFKRSRIFRQNVKYKSQKCSLSFRTSSNTDDFKVLTKSNDKTPHQFNQSGSRLDADECSVKTEDFSQKNPGKAFYSCYCSSCGNFENQSKEHHVSKKLKTDFFDKIVVNQPEMKFHKVPSPRNYHHEIKDGRRTIPLIKLKEEIFSATETFNEGCRCKNINIPEIKGSGRIIPLIKLKGNNFPAAQTLKEELTLKNVNLSETKDGRIIPLIKVKEEIFPDTQALKEGLTLKNINIPETKDCGRIIPLIKLKEEIFPAAQTLKEELAVKNINIPEIKEGGRVTPFKLKEAIFPGMQTLKEGLPLKNFYIPGTKDGEIIPSIELKEEIFPVTRTLKERIALKNINIPEIKEGGRIIPFKLKEAIFPGIQTWKEGLTLKNINTSETKDGGRIIPSIKLNEEIFPATQTLKEGLTLKNNILHSVSSSDKEAELPESKDEKTALIRTNQFQRKKERKTIPFFPSEVEGEILSATKTLTEELKPKNIDISHIVSCSDNLTSFSVFKRNMLIKYLHNLEKQGFVSTWDLLQSENDLIRDCAYDALTYLPSIKK